jgi:hypothetical protein
VAIRIDDVGLLAHAADGPPVAVGRSAPPATASAKRAPRKRLAMRLYRAAVA